MKEKERKEGRKGGMWGGEGREGGREGGRRGAEGGRKSLIKGGKTSQATDSSETTFKVRRQCNDTSKTLEGWRPKPRAPATFKPSHKPRSHSFEYAAPR